MLELGSIFLIGFIVIIMFSLIYTKLLLNEKLLKQQIYMLGIYMGLEIEEIENIINKVE